MYKDLKYIIKRVIIGTLIALILMFISQYKVKAATYQSQALNADGIMYENSRTYEKSVNLFSNYGKGYVTFTYSYSPLYGNYQIFRVVNEIKIITANGNQFICNIGGDNSYWNNQNQYIFGTAICAIDTTGTYINKLTFGGDHQTGYQGIQIRTSSIITFIQDDGSADIDRVINSIISATSTLSNSTQVQTNYLLDALQRQNTSLIQQQQQINNSITNIDDTLNNDDIDNNSVNTDTSSWSNMNATNGTITNLLTLPIQLLQGYVNGINSTCSSFSLGTLMGTNIILPCVNVSNLIGSALWSVIDVLFSGFMIFNISKKLIKIFNDFTNLRSNQIDELYGGGA